jgi:hypothetical protein
MYRTHRRQAQKHSKGALQMQTVAPTPLSLSTRSPYLQSCSRSLDANRTSKAAPVLHIIESVTDSAPKREAVKHSETPPPIETLPLRPLPFSTHSRISYAQLIEERP